MNTPSFKEDHISQIPALQMLVKLGYRYLSTAEAERKGWQNYKCAAGRCVAKAIERHQQPQGKCKQNPHFHR